MTKRAIHSDAAPAALGPYAQALRAGNTLYRTRDSRTNFNILAKQNNTSIL